MNARPVYLLHPDPAVRHSLRQALEAAGPVEELDGPGALLDRVTLVPPGVIVAGLDAGGEGHGVASLLALVVGAYPDVRVVGLVRTTGLEEVRRLLRAGIHDVLFDPPDPAACAAAVLALLHRPAIAGPGLGGFTVAVTSSKGGAGATTTAVNLVALLGRLGPAALVDADAPTFGTVGTALFDDPPAWTPVARLLQQNLPLHPMLFPRAGLAHRGGFTAFTLWERPQDLDVVGPHLGAALDALAAAYAYVVADVGRSVCEAQDAILQRADALVCMTRIEVGALRNLKALGERLGALGIGARKVLFAATAGPAGGDLTPEHAEEVLGHRFDAVLPETPALRRLGDLGEIAVQTAPDLEWVREVARVRDLLVARRQEALQRLLPGAA